MSDPHQMYQELSDYYNLLDMGVLIVDHDLNILFMNTWIQHRLPETARQIRNLTELGIEKKAQTIIRDTITCQTPRILSQAFHSWMIPLPDKRFPDGCMRQGCVISPLLWKPTQERTAHIQIRDVSDAVLRIQSLKQTQQRLSERTQELEAANTELQNEIDHRRKAEEQLKGNLLFLQSLMDAIPNPIFYKDIQGRYQGCNAAFERFIGLKRRDIIGKMDMAIFPKEIAELHIQIDQKLITEKGVQIYEGKARTGDGRIRDLEIYKTIYYTLSGLPGGIVGTFIDMTERNQKEAELEEARQKAEASNQAKNRFLAHMSHELRTPLNSVMGFCQLLKMDPNLTPLQIEHIDLIYNSGNHLLNLITHILDLAKVEAGYVENHPSECHLVEFLIEFIKIFKIQAEKKKLGMVYMFSDNLPEFVYVDRDKLRQVLFNLLDNAIKFTFEGNVGLHVMMIEQEIIRFQVWDTGVGISPEHLEMIFRPFEKIHPNGRIVDGLGVGLTLCQKYLHLLGSELHVSSEHGKGTSIYFDLKLPGIVPKRVKTSRKRIGYKGKRFKILIVDDDVISKRMVSSILGNLGFEIIEAVDGEECIRQAETQGPDLILIDVKMPATILEAAKYIRGTHHIPIVAISGTVDANIQKYIAAAGITDLIEKPINYLEIIDKCNKYLDIQWIYKDEDSKDSGLPEDRLSGEDKKPALTLPSDYSL